MAAILFQWVQMILSITYTLVGLFIFYLLATIKNFILSKPPGRCLSYPTTRMLNFSCYCSADPCVAKHIWVSSPLTGFLKYGPLAVFKASDNISDFLTYGGPKGTKDKVKSLQQEVGPWRGP